MSALVCWAMADRFRSSRMASEGYPECRVVGCTAPVHPVQMVRGICLYHALAAQDEARITPRMQARHG